MWCGVLGLLVLLGFAAKRSGRLRVAALTPITAGLAICFVFLFVRTQNAGFVNMLGFTSRIDRGVKAIRLFPNATDTSLALDYPDTNALRTWLTQLKDADIGLR
jgi:hypothetical protein